jgi:tRNA1(Val) A37 N6-methylase TrmN6
MPLFQKSVVNKYLKNLNPATVAEAYTQFQQFYGDAERIENIRLLKEENYQEGFLREIFVDVLGYTINPNKNYNLTTEYKNETDSKKADGAILLDGKAIGVIELKSTSTPYLESIREQAFNYKNNQTNCRFVITSNFEKLRFYIDNATDWEEFNLFNLDVENFRKFYLLLSKDSIFNGVTTKLKDESKLHEEDITNKLYNDYSVFKHQLFNDLIKLNPVQDKLLLFHKSQKLLDRILFVLFAEDRGLLPPNAITRIIDQWKTLKDLDEEKSLYSRFIKLFHHLDDGHKYKEYELPAYNGGLFKKDSVLDSLIISDNILDTNTIKLSTYDYNTEVDVNILGHIFENSITEIEQVKAEIEGEQTDKNRSRRKKEGIFYTPKYITKYIVDNTVGALCNAKKKELGIDAIENEIIENSRTSKGKLSKKAETLLKKLDDYRAYLLTLKILDPACGSGAFLNQALEFLINEHELIDSYRRELEKDSLGLYDITKSILENNLYGVDINEEAVEIAKLSLWIRTAERGRKLSDLNSNIKCGNSLIDNPAVAGDKAFDWNKEFPEIMKAGGFDVVIGNPPYVNAIEVKKTFSVNAFKFLKNNYLTAKGTVDLYIYFFEKGLNLLKPNSYLAFITPNRYLSVSYGIALRNFILEKTQIQKIIDYSDKKVFKDVSTYPVISILKTITQKNSYSFFVSKCHSNGSSTSIIDRAVFDSSQLTLLEDNIWGFLLNDKLEITKKIISQSKSLNSVCKINATSTAGEADEYHNIINETNGFKLINTGTIDRYNSLWGYEALIDKGNNYLTPYLPSNSNLISQNRQELYGRSKIIIAKIALRSEAYLDEFGVYASINTNCLHSFNDNINPKFILGWINSKLFQFVFECFFDGLRMAGGYLLYSAPNLNSTFIKVPTKNINDSMTSLVDKIIFLNQNINAKTSTFLSRIESNFTIDKLSNKTKEFYNYDFKTFVSELKKKKITIALKQQDEWEQYFNEYKTEINKLQQQITQTDKEIDQLVYKLYGLTEEEIKIVENSIK